MQLWLVDPQPASSASSFRVRDVLTSFFNPPDPAGKIGDLLYRSEHKLALICLDSGQLHA